MNILRMVLRSQQLKVLQRGEYLSLNMTDIFKREIQCRHVNKQTLKKYKSLRPQWIKRVWPSEKAP